MQIHQSVSQLPPFSAVWGTIIPDEGGLSERFWSWQKSTCPLFFFLSSSSSVAVRGKKDGDREHPGDFHKKELL